MHASIALGCISDPQPRKQDVYNVLTPNNHAVLELSTLATQTMRMRLDKEDRAEIEGQDRRQ